MANPKTSFNRVSLYEQVATRLQRNIREHNRQGDRLPSEMELAKELGVSSITLREALSILSNRGVIERRHGSGTYVADPAANQWVAIVTSLDLSHPNLSYFHRRVAFLLRALIAEAGLPVRIYSGSALGWIAGDGKGELPEAFFKDLEGDLIRAAVLLSDDGAHVKKFRGIEIPLVGTHPDFRFSVSLPIPELVPAATYAMASQGCRTAAFITGPLDQAGMKSLEAALARDGMSTRPEWISSMNSQAKDAVGWRALLSVWGAHNVKPDCVIVTDDVLFHEASMAILHERIDVPSKLKVFTHYNKGSGIIIPFPCTIFEIDPDEFANELAALCRMVLAPDPPKSKQIRVQARIAERTEP